VLELHSLLAGRSTHQSLVAVVILSEKGSTKLALIPGGVCRIGDCKETW